MVNFLTKNQNSLGIGHKKIGDFNWKWQEEDHDTRKCTKVEKLTALTRRLIGPGPIDRFIGASNLNTLLRFIFSPVSSSSSRFLLIQLPMSDFWGHCSRLRASDWFLEARVLDLGRLLLLQRPIVNFSSIPAHIGFRVCVLLSLPALSPLFLHFSWLLRESGLHLGHKASV